MQKRWIFAAAVVLFCSVGCGNTQEKDDLSGAQKAVKEFLHSKAGSSATVEFLCWWPHNEANGGLRCRYRVHDGETPGQIREDEFLVEDG